jgi:PAS domain S-box-containing protein
MPSRASRHLEKENAELRLRLAEAEETLHAIRAGDVDSLLIDGPGGLKVYALEGVNQSYRALVEAMSEGAASLSVDGVVLYCNGHFASLLGAPLAQVMGRSFLEFLPAASRVAFAALVEQSRASEAKGEVQLQTCDGEERAALLSMSSIDDGGARVLCLLATDLREHNRKQEADAAIERSALEQAYREELQRMAFEAAQAEERERRRIAVDLHDRIGQSIALAQIKLGAVRNEIGAPCAERVQGAIALLAQCSDEMRTLVFDLSPPVLYDLGIKAALGWLIEQIERDSDVRVELADDGADKPLDELTAGLVFRAVRELLVNVVKHSRSVTARVSLSRVDDCVEVVVHDAGEGFDASSGVTDRGFGLFSVREQMRRLGGTLTLSSSPRHGTDVALRAPLNSRVSGGRFTP